MIKILFICHGKADEVLDFPRFFEGSRESSGWI